MRKNRSPYYISLIVPHSPEKQLQVSFQNLGTTFPVCSQPGQAEHLPAGGRGEKQSWSCASRMKPLLSGLHEQKAHRGLKPFLKF